MVCHRINGLAGGLGVCRVLAGGVLVLKARGERLADQDLLPFMSEDGLVIVATPKHDPTELVHHEQRVLHDVGWNIVAVGQHSNTCFMQAVRVAHVGAVRVYADRQRRQQRIRGKRALAIESNPGL